MKNGVVIVGAGHAGVQAAASLREEGYDGPVILVGDENELPYHKPPLSKTFIKDAEAKPQPLRGEAFYTGSAIDYRPGIRIERIDAGRPQAGNSRRRRAGLRPPDPGDRLAAAHPAVAGRRSVRRAVAALARRCAADPRTQRAKRRRRHPRRRLHRAGDRRDAARRPAARSPWSRPSTGCSAAPWRRSWRAMSGSGWKRSACASSPAPPIARLEGENGHVAAAITSTGERLPARMVIVGIGAVPNVELAQAAGLAIANGIRVDQQMRSSVPEILAIGDAASYRHWFTGGDVRLESVQNATDQARLAARTITGHADAYYGGAVVLVGHRRHEAADGRADRRAATAMSCWATWPTTSSRSTTMPATGCSASNRSTGPATTCSAARCSAPASRRRRRRSRRARWAEGGAGRVSAG